MVLIIHCIQVYEIGVLIYKTEAVIYHTQMYKYFEKLTIFHTSFVCLLGARFSTAVQTGHGAHPASYKMGTGYLSRG
jgi:hypothetical protein